MAATGPFWSFTWYREGYQKTFDTYVSPEQKETEKNITPPIFIKSESITLDDILAKTDNTFDFEGSVRITLPTSESEAIAVRKYQSGFFAGTGSDELQMSPENLEILDLKLFSDLSFRQQIGRSVKALHTGEIFGQFSKFLWFLVCAVATSLPITGTLIWWNKRKKKTSNRKSVRERQTEMA